MMIELTIVAAVTIGAYEGFQHFCGKKRNAALDFAVKSSDALAKARIAHRNHRRMRRA